MTTGRRRKRTFRRISSVLSRSNYPFKPAHSSLYDLRRTTLLRSPRCRTLPFSLQTYLSSRCVLVFCKGELDDDANNNFQRTIGFLDPSAQASAPGWPLRNLLAYLRAVHPEATQTVRVLCWRGNSLSSRFGILRGGPTSAEKPSVVGWEKNVQGKLGARVADLAPMMDPKRSALPLPPPTHG
jgi:hypothetical protein